MQANDGGSGCSRPSARTPPSARGRRPAPLRQSHARHTASRLSRLRWQQAPATEPEVVRAIARMGADLHLAWDYAVNHDRDLAVERPPASTTSPTRGNGATCSRGVWSSRAGTSNIHSCPGRWRRPPQQPGPTATSRKRNAWPSAASRPPTARTTRLRHARWSRPPTSPCSPAGRRRRRAVPRAGAVPAAGELIQSLMSRISVCQVLAYAGRVDGARTLLRGIHARAEAMGNPTALSWAHLTRRGLGPIRPDTARRLQGCVEHGRRSDNRLFVGLARSSARPSRRDRTEPALAR